ncbi:cytochrome-c peroxidase [Maribacter chungangensis]|uniref:Cytochrome-c peroxidase n=1 Tax=Maribacter chungangensis TaxID=1069117 RepID=A0ABW3B1A3_9FLAO
MKFFTLRPTLSIFLISLFFSCAPDTDLYLEISQEEPLKEQIKSVVDITTLLLPDNTILDIPIDPKNPITAEKVALGKLLFHETGIGLAPKKEKGKETYSCASCHHVKAGFQSGMKQGIGEGGFGFGLFGEMRKIDADYDPTIIDVQPIRTPTILNVAYQDVMLWNGQFGATKTNAGTESEWTAGTPKETNALGFEGVEIQAIAGLGVHRLEIDPEMIASGPYKRLFDSAFPQVPLEERYSKINAGLAIAAYERTVVASEAPFQKWLKGDERAMDESQKKGAMLFFGKGKCYSCHSGPGMNGMSFHALGMGDLSGEDIHLKPGINDKLGRGAFTKNPEDNYAFKTPTLYNLKGLRFLGHGGSFSSVREVIEYKNKAEAENKDVPEENLDPAFVPLGLTEIEIDQLTDFVELSLFDDNLERYVPDRLPTGACFPNADQQSKEDMDCI